MHEFRGESGSGIETDRFLKGQATEAGAQIFQGNEMQQTQRLGKR